MSKEKKKLTDSQCEIRKQVAIEVKMRSEEITAEIMAALDDSIARILRKIDVEKEIDRRITAAVGNDSYLKKRVTSMLENKMAAMTRAAVKKHLPKSIQLNVELK